MKAAGTAPRTLAPSSEWIAHYKRTIRAHGGKPLSASDYRTDASYEMALNDQLQSIEEALAEAVS